MGRTDRGTEVVAKEYRVGFFFFFFRFKNVLRLIVVMVAQTCDYTKNHTIVYFTWVNCMVYKLYLTKSTKREKKKKIMVGQYL